MADNADWNDENTSLVCELFAAEVRAHNRSGTHLNKTGYKNVMEKFKQRTGGLSYTKLQFKNKWDKMRTEYANWKRLAKESGIGWDPAKNTYKATDDWWKKANKQYKGIAKFKDGPLKNEEEKTIMFEDIRNTGDDHWAPSSGTAPQSPEAENGNEDEDKDEDYDGNEGTDDCEEISPPTAKGKCHAPFSRKDKGKKPKTSGGHWVQDQLSKLVTE